MSNTFDSVRNHPVLLDAIKTLAVNQFCSDYKVNGYLPIDDEKLRQAGWLASILANSSEEKHQFIAASFAKLLFLQYNKDESKTQLSYTILSRTGNLAAANHLQTVYEEQNADTNIRKFRKSFGIVLDFEVGTKRNINKIETGNTTYFVTDFQRELWDNLQIHNRIAISAPTSAGKSFFIQRFIGSLFSTNSEFKVIYIVPTRALISQVSDDFKKILDKDVLIKTAFVEDSQEAIETSQNNKNNLKEIYCVTPERCLKLLQQGWNKKFYPNFIFVDEIQNVETNDNRAVLLISILSEMPRIWINAKILFAGPFINNGKELYTKLMSLSAEEVHTYLPPVYQLRLAVKYINNDTIKVNLFLNDKKTHSIEISEDLKVNNYVANKFYLAPIVRRFGKPDGNLIYSPKANYCVSYAIEFVRELRRYGDKPKDIHPAIKRFIDLLKEEIHKDYYLIYCLEYNVAFHHGKLPDFVRNEVEYLFEKGYIKYLFCTSTLLQGVNLPAPRMFIISPKKDGAELSHFEFSNLIGRAGRIGARMIGTVFCLEVSPSDNWADSYYNTEQYTKEVKLITDEVMKQDTQAIVDVLNREPRFLKHKGDEYTGNYIKQKYIEEPSNFISYLEGRGLDKNKVNIISDIITEKLGKFTIPKDVVRLNPSIDPILQNKLYETIKSDGFEEWVIIDQELGNDNFGKVFMTRKNAEALSIQQASFYYQFENLILKLDRIFAMWKEASIRSTSAGARQMAYYGFVWLQSLSLADLIQEDIQYYREEYPSEMKLKGEVRMVNNIINHVINYNSILVTFILVKYFKVYTDILASLMTEEQKKLYHRTLNLPTMLELGTRKIDVLIMISRGISRSVAIKISNHIPDEMKKAPMEWLEKITKTEELPLKAFYLEYLQRKGFIAELRDKIS